MFIHTSKLSKAAIECEYGLQDEILYPLLKVQILSENTTIKNYSSMGLIIIKHGKT